MSTRMSRILLLCLSTVISLSGCGDSKVPDQTASELSTEGQSTPSAPGNGPEEAVRLVEQAISQITSQQFDEAISLLNRAIELDHQNAEAHFQRAGILADVGQDQLSLNDYTRATELNPNEARYRNMRGLFLLTRSQLDTALDDFSTAIQIDPKFVQAWNNRGLVQLARTNFQTAIDDFNKACEIDPTYADGYNNRGFAWFKLGQDDRALEDFDRTLELSPKYVNAFNNRGMLHLKMKNFEAAINDFSAAIRFDEQNPKHYQNRMNAYRELGQDELAKADEDRIVWLVRLGQLNNAVAQAPQKPDGYIQRASHLAEAGKHEIALVNFEQAIKVAADRPEPWTSRARYWLNQRDFEKAIQDATKAIETEFSHKALSIRGDAWLALGQFEKAIADYEAGKRLDATVGRAYYERALQHRQKGNTPGFQADLERALLLDPSLNPRP